MAFPLFPLLASGGLLLRASPHIFRYLAPKAVTGANRLGQLITKSPVGKFATKNPKFTASMVGGSAIESMMSPEEAHAPTGPKLPNMPQPQEPLPPNMVSGAEMPLGVGNHPPLPEALEDNLQELKPKVDVPQAQPLVSTAQTPPSEPTDLDKFLQSNTYKFFQSDAYQKLKDLFAGMSAAPSDGSGWDVLASGVKHLNEGDKQRGQVNQTVEYLKSKGYSEEEARVMARNPQMLNELFIREINARDNFQQTSNKMNATLPKVSADYDVFRNPETGEVEAKVIKGSKTYEEKKEKFLRQKQFFKDEIISQDTNIRLLEQTEKIIQSTLTGTNILAPVFSLLNNSDALILKSNLEAIKKNLARETLEEMKQKSPNGASGYGNMNIQEFTSLQTRLGNLDPKLPRDLLLQEISAVKEAVLQARSNTYKLLNDWDKQEGGQLQSPISKFRYVTNKAQEDALPKGTFFRDQYNLVRGKGY
ncbi:hypothetical protein [Bartonella sp. MM73XJBT.G]|uniref:hypothetical protein n=1 Tax=Bartonella sp. MM73XJBT.G TaxID=3019097 RepID=UPI00235E50E2|nr:hypothetical protein [Bartonella sp. MM73XJBT.G]